MPDHPFLGVLLAPPHDRLDLRSHADAGPCGSAPQRIPEAACTESTWSSAFLPRCVANGHAERARACGEHAMTGRVNYGSGHSSGPSSLTLDHARSNHRGVTMTPSSQPEAPRTVSTSSSGSLARWPRFPILANPQYRAAADDLYKIAHMLLDAKWKHDEGGLKIVSYCSISGTRMPEVIFSISLRTIAPRKVVEGFAK